MSQGFDLGLVSVITACWGKDMECCYGDCHDMRPLPHMKVPCAMAASRDVFPSPQTATES